MTAQTVLWPGWETVRLIGRGSFGTVYEIQRDMLGQIEKAALKVITIPQHDSDIDELYCEGYNKDSLTNTFKNHLKDIISEYALMRKMNGSANIVSCDDVRYVQHEDGIGWDIYIKMELLAPLPKILPAQITEETVIRIAKDLCHALELCRKHGIVHRDIKPQNIFLSPNGDYKLGDFGIAKTMEKTSGGTKIGTYRYMAPEIYHNQPYGAGADIYSLGLVLYWLLNHRRMPFMPLPPVAISAGLDEHARMRRFSGEPLPLPAGGRRELQTIVLKACAFDPRNRYPSAAAMLEALEHLTVGVPQHISTGHAEYEADEGTASIWDCEQAVDQFQNTQAVTEDPEATLGVFSYLKKDTPQPVSHPTPPPSQPIVQPHPPVQTMYQAAPVQTEYAQPVYQAPPVQTAYMPPVLYTPAPISAESPKKKSKALAIFLGVFPETSIFGIHDFYLGNKKRGLLKLCTLNFCMFGWFWDTVLFIIGKYQKPDGTYL